MMILRLLGFMCMITWFKIRPEELPMYVKIHHGIYLFIHPRIHLANDLQVSHGAHLLVYKPDLLKQVWKILTC